MVGVPRSTGCQLCVRRKVKCDQTKPGCANCAKYGAPCPGYERGFKFVAGKHHTRRRRPPPGRPTQSPEETGQQPKDAGVPDGGPDENAPLVLVAPPLENRGQFALSLLHNVTGARWGEQLRVFAPWFSFVPARLGQEGPLDGAVSALILHLLGKADKDDALVHRSRFAYGQSLASLQRDLNHPVRWNSSETLCAAMTMCLFELFAGTTDSNSWMHHASGIARLIQQRGPGAYRGAWDSSMLLSFRTIIIMNSMFSFQDCFLAKKKWQQAQADMGAKAAEGESQKNHQVLIDEYLTSLAKIPKVLHRGLAVRESNAHGMPVDPAEAESLVREAVQLRQVFLAWFESFSALDLGPTEVPSQDPESIFQTALRFRTAWTGSLYMNYWATMLILQEVLNYCRYRTDFSEENRVLGTDILRSVETVATDVMGPLRVAYPLRIAYEVSDTPQRVWIRSVLAKLHKYYAAASPDEYPEIGAP